MNKIILALVIMSVLPAIAVAEQDENNEGAKKHVMQNSNPSPAKKPEHVMKNTHFYTVVKAEEDEAPKHVMKNN